MPAKATKPALKRVLRERWGPVKIIDGPFRGRVGWYDDDEPDGVVVYLGEPHAGEYLILKRANVRVAPYPAAQRWLRRYLPDYSDKAKRRRRKYGRLRLVDGGRKD